MKNNNIEKIESQGKIYHFLGDKRLISVSALTKLFVKKVYLTTPTYILDKAREAGEVIHQNIKDFVTKIDTEALPTTKEFYIWYAKNIQNDSIICFEKEVSNNIFIGYIDIELEKSFIELKTRSNDELDFETILQCDIYKRLINKPYHIVNINRKTNKVTELKPTDNQIKTVNDLIHRFIEFYNLYYFAKENK